MPIDLLSPVVESRPTGLTEQEAAARLAVEGPNELPSARPRNLLEIALAVLREPMLLLLVASAATYLLLGDLEEAIALVAAVFVVIGITLYQEHKTERTLFALRDLSSPRALVIRNGETRRIAGRDVVRGDVLILSEGDRVAADATVLSATGLSVDESLLTGESTPASKLPDDGQSSVYSGTLITSGHGVARAYATGGRTEIGRIGKALATIETNRTALEEEVSRVVRIVALLGLAACALVGVAYGLSRGRWLDGALAGLTMAISMIPEEFPVILTVFLALGAWRISQNRVLTRRFPAIETLGSATVLCADKTGTLTMNHMAVAVVYAGHELCAVQGPSGNVLWRALTGEVSDAMTIADGVLIVLTDERTKLRGLDPHTGRTLWAISPPDKVKDDPFNGADPARSITARGPFALFECEDGTAHVVEAKTGRIVFWKKGEFEWFALGLPGLACICSEDEKRDE